MQANTFAITTRTSRSNVVGIIVLVMVGLLTCQAMAVTSITDVNVMNKPDRVVISVQGSAPLKMTVLSSSSGHYLGFQFAGRLVSKGRMVSIHGGRISNVRYSRYQENPPLARVVLNTSSHLDYSTQWNDDRTHVDITVWKFGASPDRAPREPSVGGKQIEATGSSQPAADPVSAMPEVAPMRLVRVAPALVRVAKSVPTPAAFGAGKKVSLNFLGADIADVLKALAVQSGENIVVGSDVTGTITVTLEAVTVEEALDYITQLSGLTYVRDQRTYLVGSMESVGGLSNAKVEIVTLAYANADDVLEMLKTQCPQIRASKISVRGGLARKHEQTFEQGKTKSDTAGQANINSQGQANVNASGQADGSSQGSANGPDKSSSGSATVNAGGDATGQSTSNAQGSMNINAKRGTESLASSTATDSPSSNMIALVGTDEKIAAAKGFIAQVEAAMKSQSADKKIGVYLVKYVNTQELANTLMSVVMGVTVTLAPSAETGPVKAGQGQVIMPVNVLSGENTNRAFDTKNNAFSNTLIIVGKAEDVQKALDTAAQFDIPGETDLATYKVMYVDPDLLAKTLRRLVPAVYVEGLGMTTSLGGDSGGAATSPAAGVPAATGQGASSGQGTTATNMSAAALDNLSRTLVITGRKGDVEKARTLIEALDVKSPQIKIEAKITSISENGGKSLGLQWGDWGSLSMLEGSIVGSVVDTAVGTVAGTITDHLFGGVGGPKNADDHITGTATSNILDNASDNTRQNTSTNSYTKGSGKFFRQPLGFSAKIDALVESGNATLLASPNLLCLEGKLGKFFAGDEVTYVSSVSASSSGEKTYQTCTVKAGVTLNVVGSVSSDGYITLVLHPEVSTYSLFTQGSVTVPTVSSRYTDNVVRVKSGTTIAMGGLIRSDEMKSMSKIPLLGDLPFFGKLFRHMVTSKDKTEVVMFITASVVND